MKSRCRWKSRVTWEWSFLSAVLLLGCLVTCRGQQGNRAQFTSPGQSILPGGFQLSPFPSNPNFFTPRNPPTGRSSSATSVQNTEFGFFPSSGPSGPSKPSFLPPPAQKSPEIQYEYYDEPEEDVIYQYPTDLGLSHKKPPSALVGGRISVNPPHSRFPQQTFTTAQLGSGSRSPNRGPPSRPVQLQQFIPLEEPEQPLQALNGRSVLRGGTSGNNIRPPPSLLRPASTSAAVAPPVAPSSTTERSRLRILPSATTRRPVPNPGRSRFSTGPSSTTTTGRSTPLSSSSRLSVATFSTSSRPPVGKGSKKESKYDGDDYTIEYIEYPEASREEGSATGGGDTTAKNKGAFDYYEVSEETAKAILKDRKHAAAAATKVQPTKPEAIVTSSTSVSKSSSSSGGSTSTTTTTTTPPPEKKEKVVVSISSSKTVSGSVSKSSKPNPTPPSSTTTTTTTPLSTTTTTTTTTSSTPRSTTEPGLKDSLPSGAETSPEYYEEEYSYHEHPSPGGVAPAVKSSTAPERQETQEEEEESPKVEEEPSPPRHPHPRKLPSKQDIAPPPNSHGLLDLEVESRVPLVRNNHPAPEEIPSTTKAPSVFGGIKFADISPDLLPPGFTFPPSTTSTTTTTTTSTPPTTTTVKPTFSTEVEEAPINFDSVPSFLLPKGYKSLGTKAPATTTPTTDLGGIPLNLLPKGYKLPESASPPPPSLSPLEALLSKIKIQEIAIPSLIPKDYTPPPGIPVAATPPPVAIPPNLLPPGFTPAPEDSIAYEIPPNLLPPGYKKPPTFTRAPPPASEVATVTKKPFGPVFPTRAPSQGGPVFPTKPGGFRVTRPTTTEHPKADTPPPPKVTIAASGWPTRKTTEFTGWPTPSTTRPPPTSPTPSTTTLEPVTTPPTTPKATTTTTPPPPKRSPLGVCPQEVCRMEATLRITGGVKWKPEFADINTEEYKHLEVTIKRELDGAYRASGLAPWYKRVTIEGFNQGSVLVDYFVELEGVDRELTTADVVKVFHKGLLDSDPGDELAPDAPFSVRFGRYNIDPRYTDFKVVTPKSGKGAPPPDTLIPQWGIAVIVIGLVSLLFLLILGVIVLVSRYKNSKKKNNVSLTQEMLNEFNKSHMAVGGGGGRGGGGGGGGHHQGPDGGVDNFGADDLYNMDDVWNDNKQMDRTFDRRPTKRSQGGSSTKGSAGPNYNIYDSWKTEWNGYFHNGNYYGDSGYAPSRRRSDYDTNF